MSVNNQNRVKPVKYIKVGWIVFGILMIINALAMFVAPSGAGEIYTLVPTAVVIFLMPIAIIMKVVAGAAGVSQQGLLISALYFCGGNFIVYLINEKAHGLAVFALIGLGVGAILIYRKKKKQWT